MQRHDLCAVAQPLQPDIRDQLVRQGADAPAGQAHDGQRQPRPQRKEAALFPSAQQQEQNKKHNGRRNPVIDGPDPGKIGNHKLSPKKLENRFISSLRWDLETEMRVSPMSR